MNYIEVMNLYSCESIESLKVSQCHDLDNLIHTGNSILLY